MSRWKKIVLIACSVLAVLLVALLFLARKPIPPEITYGVSFNVPYAHELGLDWREVYDAVIDELGVRHLRLAAHWTVIEPWEDVYDFAALDYQLSRAEDVGAEIALAVGRRLPRWPECHIPEWAAGLSWEEQKAQLRDYITAVVTRYRDNPAIRYWQVENEPYFTAFAHEHCGDLDEDFLHEEIALVRSLDDRPVLVTDSGNLGKWYGAYGAGDAFGTSVYLYLWHPTVGPFRTVLPPSFYRVKENVMRLVRGNKPTLLIELSAEPWLLESVADAPLEVQLERMNPEKFAELLAYARDTRYDTQYLWGAEWWYWMREQGDPAMWDMAKPLFHR